MVRKLSPEKREKILRTALALFVKNGVQNTTTAEIAKEAGIAAGTLFLYFSTKQALLDELVMKIGKEESDEVKKQLEPSLSARETFRTIWNGSTHWIMQNIDAFRYVQQVRDTGMVSASVVLESAKFFSFYYEAIQKGYQEGSIKPFPIDLIGGFLYQDLVAILTYLQMQTDPSQQEEAIRQGFEIFWGGIKSRS